MTVKNKTIAITGNPNCGKTTLFNLLTGTRQKVGNWPGVTVDKKTGSFEHKDTKIEVVDLPGTYSLGVASAASIDERIARSYVLSRKADIVINIVDASNLERNLYLTTQLIEMKVPFILALNMMDVAENRNIRIDIKELQKKLGCPVISMTARNNIGIEELKNAIIVKDIEKPDAKVAYTSEIETAVKVLEPAIERVHFHSDYKLDSRWLALQMLEGDMEARELLKKDDSDHLLTEQIEVFEKNLCKDPDTLIAESRYGFIQNICNLAITRKSGFSRTFSDKIDSVILNSFFGIPIFLMFMYLMFMWTINIGGSFIDFFDIFASTIFVEGFGCLLDSMGTPEYMKVVFAGGVGGGIQTVATFIPVIGFLFLFLSFLEDSGYMSRAAFVMDRFMRKIGLPGKAFIPMIVGFGCTVPAIMATRTLGKQRDRLITMFMAPFMSCGAKMPVYALFVAAFFPESGQNLVFGLYLIGIVMAILTGLILKNTLFIGDPSPMIMELPPYHLPTFRNVFLHTWERLKSFIFQAGKIIIPIVVILNFANSVGTDGSFGNEDSNKSVLASIGRSIVPVFEPMGITDENWPATVGIFTGVFAKEAVVGTLNALYANVAKDDGAAPQAEAEFNFMDGLASAFATIPENLGGVTDSLADPMGLGVGDSAEAAESLEVSNTTFGAMVARFDGKAGAFAYLLFILLYFPCLAAIAAVFNEAGLLWAVFVGSWTTGLAYMTSVTFYQAATYAKHPESSMIWIGAIVVVFCAVVAYLRHAGAKLTAETDGLSAYVCKGVCHKCR